MSAPKVQSEASASAYVDAWRDRAAALDAERLRDLRALTETAAARRFADLLQPAGVIPSRPSSGLVEQQRIFNRLRRTST